MTNPRAIEVESAENRRYVCAGLSQLADSYIKQAKKADEMGDEHTKAYCNRVGSFLVLELRPKYGALDGFGDKLAKKLEKAMRPKSDPRQRSLDLSSHKNKTTKKKATKKRKRKK